jgi:SAM-dependent methyltransferase
MAGELWLGENKLELRPAPAELGKVIYQQTQNRQFEEDSAAWISAKVNKDLKGAEQEVKKFKDAPFTPYADLWLDIIMKGSERDSSFINRSLEKLKGQTVVDLGCGRNYPAFQGFLKTYGLRDYIGVETHVIFGNDRARPVEGLGDVAYLDEDEGDATDGAVIRGDMLRVISRLPDLSFSVALNGIDDYVVNSETPYGVRLAEEIARVLHPDGLCIGVTGNGGVLELLKQNTFLRTQTLPIPNTDPDVVANFYFISKISN